MAYGRKSPSISFSPSPTPSPFFSPKAAAQRPLLPGGPEKSASDPGWRSYSTRPRGAPWTRRSSLKCWTLLALTACLALAGLNTARRGRRPSDLLAQLHAWTGDTTDEIYTLAVVLDEVPWVDRTPEFLAWTRGKQQPGFPPVEWTARDFLPPYPCPRGRLPSLSSPPSPSKSLAVHHTRAPPRQVVVPAGAPELEELVFISPAFSGRLNESLRVFENVLADTNIPCLIAFPPEDAEFIDNGTIPDAFRASGLDCSVYASSKDGVGDRVFDLVETAVEFAHGLQGRDVKWFMFGDDDTLWLDLDATRRTLAKYDPKEDWLIGSRSETEIQIKNLEGILFGGAGFFVSRALMEKLHGSFDDCIAHMDTSRLVLWGGDARISYCTARLRNSTMWDVLEVNPFMHQTDTRGDSTGFFQAGIPAHTIHHTLQGGWTQLSRLSSHTPMASTLLLLRAARFLGGDVLLSRSVFESGRVLLVHGHSISIYLRPLAPEMLERAELTMETEWSGYRFPTRPPVPERRELEARNGTNGTAEAEMGWKTTYYLWAVEERGEKAAEFVYREEGGDRIRVLYVDGRPLPG